MIIKIVFDCYVISFLCSLIFLLLFFGNHYGGNHVLGRGGRTKMAIRSRGGGQGGGWEGVGGEGEHYPRRVGLRNVCVSGSLHQFSKNVNGSRPISVVGET